MPKSILERSGYSACHGCDHSMDSPQDSTFGYLFIRHKINSDNGVSKTTFMVAPNEVFCLLLGLPVSRFGLCQSYSPKNSSQSNNQ